MTAPARLPTQLSAVEDDTGIVTLVALANDGTMWTRWLDAKGKWHQVPTLPQPGEGV